MRASALKYTIVAALSSLCMLVIALIPFHAFLTVWLSSLTGHYTALRLWKEVILLVGVIGVLYLMMADHKIRSHTLSRRLVWLIIAYIALNIGWGLFAYLQNDVSLKAFAYGCLLNTRFLIFFLVVWALALRTQRLRKRWQPLVLYPAAIVVIFGLLQVFVLPNNFLGHFGYGLHTIEPYETINNNQNYIRIASTLRGANPLGAYLLIPISVLVTLIIRGRRGWQYIVLLAASLTALCFSFSRSAWLGTAVTVSFIVLIGLRSRRLKLGLAVAACVVLLAVGSVAVVWRNNVHFQNVFLHTQTNSTSKVSSNDDHVSALNRGLEDIERDPLGIGTGTAGPASVYTEGSPRIAENYYVQIGQELGILGLGLFLLINLGVGYLLWMRRSDALALALLASLIGISVINLLSHAWTDDTLAYLWWGLAGIAMVATNKTNKQTELPKK